MSDLIKRDDAIEAIKKCSEPYVEFMLNDYYMAVQAVERVPSAQPEKAQLSQEDATFDTPTGIIDRPTNAPTDCISRQAAIDALGERPLLWTGGDYELGCANQYDLDKSAIETVPSSQPELKWIPCSDKTPSESQECWITAKDGTVCQGMYTRRYGERRDSGFICNGFGFAWLNAVAAWMPYEKPEPYREEGEK